MIPLSTPATRGALSVPYPAMLDVPHELVEHVAWLLYEHRRALSWTANDGVPDTVVSAWAAIPTSASPNGSTYTPIHRASKPARRSSANFSANHDHHDCEKL